MAWSCAVMKERRMLGTGLAFRGAAGVEAAGFGVWNEAAISLKPVGWGLTGGGGGAREAMD